MRKSILLSTTLILLLVITLLFSPNVVFAENENYLYLGGFVVGIDLRIDGLYITSKLNVVTKNGIECPFDDADILMGDILYAIDGNIIKSQSDIENIIDNKHSVKVTIKRGDTFLNYSIKPSLDLINNKNKLGLLIQDKVAGIGTVTYIDPNNFSYAALGHPIKDYQNKDILNAKGNIYKAKVIGVNKPTKNKAGELNGTFSLKSNPIGIILNSTKTGIYGTIKDNSFLKTKVLVGKKTDVKTGPAKIYCTVSEDAPKYYDIQILRINNDDSSNKSMLIKVSDKKLLEISGGIVQGMSGSPIIQNGKLIGAVTHVFLNDPTRGYGIFIEDMFS